ncbi:hypothetical protein [Flavobacterium sp.]|jgi:hypothetical protein|uniref:hypothetical protein n=1 Tax=Flavobacterium sp. TaxID=239 RepID=UPI0037BFA5DE
MKIFLICAHLFFVNIIFAQNCKEFQIGIYTNENPFGKMIIEREGDFQLEKTVDNSTIYLQKIEKISECEYRLKRYKVISLGRLPEPNMKELVSVKITNVNGDNFEYKAQLVGTELTIKGNFIKISQDISDEFKKIIENER